MENNQDERPYFERYEVADDVGYNRQYCIRGFSRPGGDKKIDTDGTIVAHGIVIRRYAEFLVNSANAALTSPAKPDVVPGMMRCAKCRFVLMRNILYVQNGTVGAGDNKTEPCPNGCGPLWPMTWKERAIEAEDELEKRILAKPEAAWNTLENYTVKRAIELGFKVHIGKHNNVWFDDEKGQMAEMAFWTERELGFYLNGFEHGCFVSKPEAVTEKSLDAAEYVTESLKLQIERSDFGEVKHYREGWNDCVDDLADKGYLDRLQQMFEENQALKAAAIKPEAVAVQEQYNPEMVEKILRAASGKPVGSFTADEFKDYLDGLVEQEPVAWRWRSMDAKIWVYDPDLEWLEAQGDSVEKEPLYTHPVNLRDLKKVREAPLTDRTKNALAILDRLIQPPTVTDKNP